MRRNKSEKVVNYQHQQSKNQQLVRVEAASEQQHRVLHLPPHRHQQRRALTLTQLVVHNDNNQISKMKMYVTLLFLLYGFSVVCSGWRSRIWFVGSKTLLLIRFDSFAEQC